MKLISLFLILLSINIISCSYNPIETSMATCMKRWEDEIHETDAQLAKHEEFFDQWKKKYADTGSWKDFLNVPSGDENEEWKKHSEQHDAIDQGEHHKLKRIVSQLKSANIWNEYARASHYANKLIPNLKDIIYQRETEYGHEGMVWTFDNGWKGEVYDERWSTVKINGIKVGWKSPSDAKTTEMFLEISYMKYSGKVQIALKGQNHDGYCHRGLAFSSYNADITTSDVLLEAGGYKDCSIAMKVSHEIFYWKIQREVGCTKSFSSASKIKIVWKLIGDRLETLYNALEDSMN